MKKLIVLVLILCLSASPALAQSRGPFTYNFAYDNAPEAKLLALECLEICGFSSEHGDQRNKLVRWADCIYVKVEGSPTPEDLEELKRFLAELGLRVPEMPSIYLTYEGDDRANLTICFVPKIHIPDVVPGYSDSWSVFNVNWWTDNHEIYGGQIGIASDVTNQRDRNYLIRQMLVGSLGLCNYHDLYDDSVLYNSWTGVQTLSELDWLMLNMLYSSSVQPGMTYEQVREAIENRYLR